MPTKIPPSLENVKINTKNFAYLKMTTKISVADISGHKSANFTFQQAKKPIPGGFAINILQR